MINTWNKYIVRSWRNGHCTFEILTDLIQEGIPRTSAVALIKEALNLDDEGVEEMEDGYDNNC